MDKNYKALLRVLPKQDRASLRQEQKNWLSDPENECRTKDMAFTFEVHECTAERTFARAEELSGRLSKLKVQR